MPNKKPLQGKPIQGGATPTVTENGYEGKVPEKDFVLLEKELLGLRHGCVTLSIFIRDGKFQYSKITKEFSRDGDDDE